MADNGNTFLVVHEISPDGATCSFQYQIENMAKEFMYRTVVDMENYSYLTPPVSPKAPLTFLKKFKPLEQIRLKITTVSNVENLGDVAPHQVHTLGFENDALLDKLKLKSPNIPTMTYCQNCETNFPTKYQYQRHQCEFNAENVVLKPNVNVKEADKGVRVTFICSACGKKFVNKNNLERHELSHDKSNVNVCEYCNKQFVSDNRLKIHKENHCKKAGEVSKFYRSDVAVWKCRACCQVFSTPSTASIHSETCTEEENLETPQGTVSSTSAGVSRPTIAAKMENEPDVDLNKIEKVMTEVLLQCEFCNRIYSDKEWLLQHQKKHTTAANYECVTCKGTFDSHLEASEHWLTMCVDKANSFYLPKLAFCEYCDRTFKSHEILYSHKYKRKHYTPKVHPQEEERAKAQEPDEPEDMIVKVMEGALGAMNASSRAHVPRGDVVAGDVEVEPSNVETLPDGEAQENRGKRRGRKRKRSSGTASKRLISVAGEGYKFQCERCSRVFDDVATLEAHKDVEHPANFKCDECSQVVHSAKALLIHSRAHKSLKPYVCDICKRSYSQTSHLWQHMRFHQGIKPFACPHEGCEARYTIRPDLKDHIRKVHTRERPFKCSVCNKCFLTGSVYYQHRLIHTNDRRYGCDTCPKRFFRADALNNHKRIHTNERPYACEVCGRQFRQKGDRNKHVRTQHPS